MQAVESRPYSRVSRRTPPGAPPRRPGPPPRPGPATPPPRAGGGGAGGGGRDRRDRALQRGLVERHEDPVGAGALAHLEAALARDEGRGMGDVEAVEVGPVLAAELEQVGEALGRDEGRGRAAPLEQRV